MASDKAYLDYIIEQLSSLDGISYRKMMGEYILYYNQKIIGGIYDNRLLLKPAESAKKFMSELRYELPYEGAKPMLLVDNIDDREYLIGLVKAVYDGLPDKKRKKQDCTI